jgi:hypothetical protein
VADGGSDVGIVFQGLPRRCGVFSNH